MDRYYWYCSMVQFHLDYHIQYLKWVIAVLISSYWIGVAISLSAKIMRSVIAFVLERYLIRERMREYMVKQKHYKTFEKVLNQEPLKFSIILRLTLLPIPVIVKSYGLAIPHTFKIYIFAVTDIIWTTISIFLYKKSYRFI